MNEAGRIRKATPDDVPRTMALIRELADDQVEVVFEIQENRKVVIQSVDFTGNDNVPDKQIERFLQLKEGLSLLAGFI